MAMKNGTNSLFYNLKKNQDYNTTIIINMGISAEQRIR